VPIIQRPDLVAKIRKAYDLAGPDAIATISPELVPVVVVDELERDGDPYKRCIGFREQTAVAGQYGEVCLFNPADSGVDLEVEEIRAHGGGTDYPHLAVYNAQLAGAGTRANRNTGLPGEPSATVAGATAAVPAGASIAKFGFTTNGNLLVLNPRYRVPPGEGIGIKANTVNLLYIVSFWWSEIPV